MQHAYANDQHAYANDQHAYANDQCAYANVQHAYANDQHAYANDQCAYACQRPTCIIPYKGINLHAITQNLKLTACVCVSVCLFQL